MAGVNMLDGPEEAYVSGRVPALLSLPTGRYWRGPGGSSTSNTRASGSLYLNPVFVCRTIEVAALIWEYTVAGSSGAVTRLGIYNPTTAYQPGTVLLDLGAQDSTVTAAAFETAISGNQVLTPGLYFLAAALQGAPGTQPTYRCVSAGFAYSITTTVLSTALQGSFAAYLTTGVTGALPDLTGVTCTASATPIAAGLKGA